MMILSQDIILVILSIVLVVLALKVLYDMPGEIIKNMEKECTEIIKEKDKEFEEKQELNKALKKWLFK